MMKYIFILISFAFNVLTIQAQTTTFNGTINDDWSVAGNWSAGIPTATTNATVATGQTATAYGVGECNNLNLFLSSLKVATGGQLTINGQYSATTTRDNIVDGTLILKGTLKPAIGTTVLTLGNGGGVTLVSGLTFSNFSLD